MLTDPVRATKRPYRSHRFPVCTRCRQRKIKCSSTQWGQACNPCHKHGARCSFTKKPSQVSNPDSEHHQAPGASSGISLAVDVDELQAEAHFVGPLLSTDTRILEKCLFEESCDGGNAEIRAVSSLPFSVLPPPRPPPSLCRCNRDLPKEFLRAIQPYWQNLLQVFLDKILPCLPTFDRKWLWQRMNSGDTLPESLLCTLYSLSLYYWNSSMRSKPLHQLNQDFAWQATAVTSIRSYSHCDLFTILSTIYNIIGRPSLCVVFNTTSVARLVALSHAIGLHHDSSSWHITQTEKDLRHNTWWAVFNIDRFYHFAQGSPSLIFDGHHDVPLPKLHDSLINAQAEPETQDRRSSACYLALCKLAELLGRILPLLFQSSLSNKFQAGSTLKDLYHDLGGWASELAKEIDFQNTSYRKEIPGLANLHLSYLAVKMLLSRVGLQLHDESDHCHFEWLTKSVEASSAVVEFATKLTVDDLYGFWFPWNAQHFSSAITLLLRCSLQSSDTDIQHSCTENAQNMLDFLTDAQHDKRWDMAMLCVSSNQKILDQVQKVLSSDFYLRRLQRSKQMQEPILESSFRSLDEQLNNESSTYSDMLAELFPELFLPFERYSQPAGGLSYI